MSALHFDSPPRSICILRLSAIGDVTHMLPLIATLQHHWPQTRITWIIGSIEYELVKSLDDIEFIVFNKRNGWREFAALRRRLAGRHFDVLLMMQVALRANLISLLLRARYRVGYDTARSRDLHGLFCNERIEGPHRVHVLDTFFQFLEKLGLSERRMDWLLQPGEAETRYAREVIGAAATVIINPCSSVRRNNWRNWSVERYAEVIDNLVNVQHKQVILTGGPSPGETGFANDILRLCKSKPLNLVGKTTLPQLLALMCQAEALIAPDTGPAHMGTVAGIPVIGLYASSNPQRTGPYNSLKDCIDAYPAAVDKYLGDKIGNIRWGRRVRDSKVMQLISVDDVLTKLGAVV